MEAHLQLYEIFLSTAKPMALQAAAFLNIPYIIATHGSENHITVEEIAFHISGSTKKPAHVGHLSRIMKLLASIDVFTEEKTIDDRCTHKFKYATLLFLNLKSMTDAYQYLHDSVIDGCQPFSKANGMNMFEYASHHHDFVIDGCQPFSKANGMNIFEYASHHHDSVIDGCGGAGSATSTIVNEYPHIQGINFDLPHVIRTAAPSKGVEHVEGNMFDRIPPANAVFMKRFLHDWDDEHCFQILKSSYEVISEDGRILIVDAVIENEEGTKRQVGLLSDILMLAVSIGGTERTEDEFKNLFYKAGFKSYNVIQLPYYHKLIEVSKK